MYLLITKSKIEGNVLHVFCACQVFKFPFRLNINRSIYLLVITKMKHFYFVNSSILCAIYWWCCGAFSCGRACFGSFKGVSRAQRIETRATSIKYWQIGLCQRVVLKMLKIKKNENENETWKLERCQWNAQITRLKIIMNHMPNAIGCLHEKSLQIQMYVCCTV